MWIFDAIRLAWAIAVLKSFKCDRAIMSSNMHTETSLKDLGVRVLHKMKHNRNLRLACMRKQNKADLFVFIVSFESN